MVKGVQHDPTSQLTRIPSTSARDNHASASVGRKSEIISGNAIGGRSVHGEMEPFGLFSVPRLAVNSRGVAVARCRLRHGSAQSGDYFQPSPFRHHRG